MSYTSQFTKQKGFIVLDEVGSRIASFYKIANETDYSLYKPKIPSIVIDRFQKNQIKIDEEKTELVKSYIDLQRMGYVVISQKINPYKAWFKGQRVFFRLCPIHSIPKNSAFYDSIPRGMQVRHDYVNKLIRLEDSPRHVRKTGRTNTSKNGKGDWYPISEKND